jgi:SAM-dependent methyltransferase
MEWNSESPLRPVCPDDLGTLEFSADRLRCRECGREFVSKSEVLEFLPKEILVESSTRGRLLNAYAKSFSDRREASWHRPLREFLNRLGNGYIYSWAALTIQEFSDRQPLSILDAGCGEGVLRQYLSSWQPYVGIDFSTRPLARAQRHYPDSYFRADLNQLPFRNETFDIVVSLQALQYLDRPDVALAEMARVLKSGGTLLLSVPNDECLKYQRQGISAIQLQRFSRQNLPELVEARFDILRIDSQGFWLPLPKLPIHVAGIYPARWGLSWTIVAKPKNQDAETLQKLNSSPLGETLKI